MKIRVWSVAGAALCFCVSTVEAQAAESCGINVTRHNVAACALANSPALAVERQGVAVLVGRERSVSPLLPSNPVLALQGGHRRTDELRATNWYATLSQEVEIAGQRNARRKAAGAARTAQEQSLVAVSRDVARDAWTAYFAALAARDALAMAQRLEQAFRAATTATAAAAESGVAAGLDADVAEAAALRLSQERIAAEQRSKQALAALAALLGADPLSPRVAIDGELLPLRTASTVALAHAEVAVEQRPEVLAAEATRHSYEQWTSVYRRSRIPNLTFSALAQRDGFNERVLGGGVSLPIPLPSPLGRTFAGEIEENTALARQAASNKERLRRELKLEVANALAAYQSAQAQAELFTAERVQRAEQTLGSIAEEIGKGRIAVANVIVAQQALIDVLRSSVEAKLALCVASVELAHAAGISLTGDGL